jgi:glycopeptide antibiotics resistance protein
MIALLICLLYVDVAVAGLALVPNLGLPDHLATLLHMSVSAVNVVVLLAAIGRVRLVLCLVFAATCLVEFAQLFVDGRTASVEDICANAIGLTIGFAVHYLLCRPSAPRDAWHAQQH